GAPLAVVRDDRRVVEIVGAGLLVRGRQADDGLERDLGAALVDRERVGAHHLAPRHEQVEVIVEAAGVGAADADAARAAAGAHVGELVAVERDRLARRRPAAGGVSAAGGAGAGGGGLAAAGPVAADAGVRPGGDDGRVVAPSAAAAAPDRVGVAGDEEAGRG